MPGPLSLLVIVSLVCFASSCTPAEPQTSAAETSARVAPQPAPPRPACEADDSCVELSAGVAGIALEGRCVPPTMLPPDSETITTQRDLQIADMVASCTARAQLGAVCSVRCNIDPVIPTAFRGPAREALIAQEIDRFAKWMRDRFGAEQSLVSTPRAGQLQREWRWRGPGQQLSLSTWYRTSAREADTRRDRRMAPRITLVYSAP